MIRLLSLFKDLILEGGNVFQDDEYRTADIDKKNIAPTIKKFVEDFSKIFPNKADTFKELTDKNNWLGSTTRTTGKAGDIDLAYSGEHLFTTSKSEPVADVKGWGVNPTEFDELYQKYQKYKKSSSKATDQSSKATDEAIQTRAIQTRALLDCIILKANEEQDVIHGSNKATNGGTLHFSYPQYDENGVMIQQDDKNGKKRALRVQLDINTGDVDWLRFRYNSELPSVEGVDSAVEDYYKKGIKDLEQLSADYKIDIEDLKKGLIKGAHRGQLMLALFAATGYTFKSGRGFIDKETKEVVAEKPEGAIQVFNTEYKPAEPLTLDIVKSYDRLKQYIDKNLKPQEKAEALDLFRKALAKTNLYVPENI